MCVGGPAWGGGGVACVGGPPLAGVVDIVGGDCRQSRGGSGPCLPSGPDATRQDATPRHGPGRLPTDTPGPDATDGRADPGRVAIGVGW